MSDNLIPLSSQDITKAEIEAVVAVLRSDRLSIGPRIEAFEAAVAARCGRKYGIGVNSGTSGLHLCIKALGIGEGDEVITTPFSFISSTNCILFERGKPVFVDIDPESYNMDVQVTEAAITPQTKAILPVEAFGNTAHFDAYERIAADHGLAMIEDCCEALGGLLGNRPAGSFGDCGVFGFYPNKQITTGEGGVIVTDNAEIAGLCRSMRNQGQRTSGSVVYERIGYNYRLSELCAALGEQQMQRLDEILKQRRRTADMYSRALADIDEIHLPPMAGADQTSWFVYVIRLADKFTGEDRDAIIAHLRGAGVECNCYFVPIHLQRYIMEMIGTKPGDFPVTERIAARTIALPFFTAMKQEQVKFVANELKSLLRTIQSSPQPQP